MTGDEHIDDVTRRLGRSPRPSEVSERMDVELDEVIEAITEHREPDTGPDLPEPSDDTPDP